MLKSKEIRKQLESSKSLKSGLLSFNNLELLDNIEQYEVDIIEVLGSEIEDMENKNFIETESGNTYKWNMDTIFIFKEILVDGKPYVILNLYIDGFINANSYSEDIMFDLSLMDLYEILASEMYKSYSFNHNGNKITISTDGMQGLFIFEIEINEESIGDTIDLWIDDDNDKKEIEKVVLGYLKEIEVL